MEADMNFNKNWLVLLFPALVILCISAGQQLYFPEKTGRITDELVIIRDDISNIYLLTDGKTWICFDAGVSERGLLEEFKKVGISPEQVTALFLSHSDIDHVGGISLFKKATIYISKEEESLLQGKTKRIHFGTITNNRKNISYSTLRDKETIKIGSFSILCILTPGHTPGSMSFLVNNRYLYVGDLAILRNGIASNFWSKLNMDDNQNRKSLRNLVNSPVKANYLLTGHTGLSRDYNGATQHLRTGTTP